MPGWMFDSVALIDYYHGRPGVIPYVEMTLNGEATGAFSTVTELELWQGIRAGEEERHEAILALLERVPLDGAIARRAGQLRRQFGLSRLSLPDAAIAASAELTGRTLLTRNTRDRVYSSLAASQADLKENGEALDNARLKDQTREKWL